MAYFAWFTFSPLAHVHAIEWGIGCLEESVWLFVALSVALRSALVAHFKESKKRLKILLPQKMSLAT
jgi:hypothetical protein